MKQSDNDNYSDRHMEDKIIYEYCTLRYVPDIERGEFVNVGLMMMCKRHRWLRTALHIDERRILALCPAADLDRLRVQLSVFARQDVPQAALPVEEKYRWMAAVKSAIIQTSPSHPGIIVPDCAVCANDPAAVGGESECLNPKERLDCKFEQLFRRLVAD